MKQGFTQVYTGDGKGKTTAAIGLSVRAAGAGLAVYFAQFLKQEDTSEHKALKKFDNITVELYSKSFELFSTNTELNRAEAQQGFNKALLAVKGGEYDVVVLDEINVALCLGLVDQSQIQQLIEQKNEKTELVLTGRGATEQTIKLADLVSEIKEVKHYYNDGVDSREGIEF